eukprot:CAMPEP_0198311878 /NCGR_PEP_ID=MMETSP1450-20131203/3469_1 /TAXON_ID=753684 ORGANISM="Madagascaria erythrocladiodes, Strain CCMP3234" /NCGR_SAMPLE_ID=MMETSP1450 /ASSEMBLY_ACC=CAM_ASM_001115 /LENGTH=41 /DNA_ID= /DNA_START= /DNA_END= /DNA_ORIENTATION=
MTPVRKANTQPPPGLKRSAGLRSSVVLQFCQAQDCEMLLRP